MAIVTVKDAFGRVVLNTNVKIYGGKIRTQINLQAQADGIYFITLQSKEEHKTIKVLVHR